MLRIEATHRGQHGADALVFANLAVDHHHRRGAAGAQAAHRSQAHPAIGTAGTQPDPQLLLQGLDQGGRPLHLTGRAVADDATVPRRRTKTEQVIEAGRAMDAAERQLQAAGDMAQQIVAEVAVELLGLVEDLDQAVGAAVMPAQDRLQGFKGLPPRGGCHFGYRVGHLAGHFVGQLAGHRAGHLLLPNR